MRYYIGSVPYGVDDIRHHGIKGMKWGVRRYQNEDGSLTEEGLRRYGSGQSDSFLRRSLEGRVGIKKRNGKVGLFSSYRDFEGKRAEYLEDKAARAEARGNMRKAEKFKIKAEAQRKKNEDIDNYMKKTPTENLIAQHLLLPAYAVRGYKTSRARGASAVRAYLENTTLIGRIAKRRAERKKYGAATATWSAFDADRGESM